MLAIPSFRRIDDVTVYQDDAVWNRFYLVPSMPSIRRDQNGRPVFLLAIYHLSDEERAEDPTKPRGGGYMNFDVQYAVEQAKEDAARRELQEWVEAEYTRRKADPQYARQPEYSSPEAPAVEFADPLLSGGTVKMLTTQAEALVTGSFAEAPASLVSGSTAVFNVDLTTTGASFMKDLMVDTDGTGNIDLTPVQIIYDLKMWARLPPVKITVTGHSERIHKTLLKISETNRDNPCTPREVESYRENGISSSNLKESGTVDVHIDKGDATVPDEVVEALQQYALDLFDTMIEERFLVPAEEDDDELEFDSDDPELHDRDAGWAAVLYADKNYKGASLEIREDTDSLGSLNNKVSSVRVRPGHKVTLHKNTNYGGTAKYLTGSSSYLGGSWNDKTSSIKVFRPPTSRSKVRKTVNHSTMNLVISIDRSQVVEWPTGGQATLAPFFAGASPSEIKRHVVEVFAGDFNTLGVTVQAFVDFENEPIQAVEVQTEYSAKDGNGETRTTPGAFTFRAGETAAQKFDPSVIGGKREYKFRHRIFYDDGTVTDYTEWETQTNRALNVSVVDPGRLELEVSGASLNWKVARAVTVKLGYAEPGDGAVERTEQTFELSELTPTRKWDQRFNRQLKGAVDAELTYYLQDDKVVEGVAHRIAITDTLFVVPPPQVDVLNVSLVPAGDWSDVAQAVVSLEYDAGEGRLYDEVFQLTGIESLAEWTVLLRDPSRRTFRYKKLVTYKSGGADQGEWTNAEGDQAILINVKGVPKLRVNVLANLVNFEKTPAVTVSLSYGSERKTLSFTSPGTAAWEVPLRPDGNRDYTYEMTWHPTDGEPISGGLQRTADTELFIPRADVPESGKLEVIVRGFAVDFTATPFVDIRLEWSDGDREESKTISLHKDAPNATWSVDVGDRTQRRYRYAITYNLADGSRVEGASGDSDDPVISVTRHQP